MAFMAVEPFPELNENPPKAEIRPGESVFLRRICAVCVFVAATVSLAAARDLALVSNKANTVSAVTLPDLAKICKAQTTHWPDGRPVTFIMRAPTAPEMKMFLEKVYELPETEVHDLINNANHGRTNHPAILVVDSDEEVVNKVASIPGAVGVVDVYAINSSVAVVKLGGKLPLEPGYALHGN
jgi:ABC-type phosphate transport system substrate-binding protein